MGSVSGSFIEALASHVRDRAPLRHSPARSATEGQRPRFRVNEAHPKAAKFVATGAGAGVGYEGLKAAGVPLP